jgi:thiosulfate dehydrogenase [quinone] large subunit
MTTNKLFSVLRTVMGFIFMWAFVDKLFGFGFATTPVKAWIRGGSPTEGFLLHGVRGPLASAFSSLAGIPLVDWLFMLGLLFVGLTLIVNRYVVLGAYAGMLMLLLMYLAAMPPENNPLIDDHIVYILVLALIAARARKAKALQLQQTQIR